MENSTNTQTNWVLDPTHSEITFRVRHLMISNVKGEFTKFTAAVKAVGTDFSAASVQATINTASIFTNDDNRDNHLRSAEFFDAETYPEMTFAGTSFQKTSGDQYELQGNLTIKGISKPVALNVEFGGTGKDPWGNEKAAFSFEGKINRKDWDLNWNATLEAGGVLVSEEVRISGELQFVKQVQA